MLNIFVLFVLSISEVFIIIYLSYSWPHYTNQGKVHININLSLVLPTENNVYEKI
jgi:hypothetical protein